MKKITCSYTVYSYTLIRNLTCLLLKEAFQVSLLLTQRLNFYFIYLLYWGCSCREICALPGDPLFVTLSHSEILFQGRNNISLRPDVNRRRRMKLCTPWTHTEPTVETNPPQNSFTVRYCEFIKRSTGSAPLVHVCVIWLSLLFTLSYLDDNAPQEMCSLLLIPPRMVDLSVTSLLLWQV